MFVKPISEDCLKFTSHFFSLDGRPAPLTQRQMGRLEERKQTAVRIFLLNSLKVIHVFKSVIVGIVVFAFFLIIFIFNSLFFL